VSEQKIPITSSSGNVFADMGMPNAEELLQKSDLVIVLKRNIERMNLSQTDAAKLIGTSQARVSGLLRGRLQGVSVGKLIDFLNRLGCDVNVKVSKPKADARGRTRITSA
jgi:predicted XRE-type DNA-binding protein